MASQKGGGERYKRHLHVSYVYVLERERKRVVSQAAFAQAFCREEKKDLGGELPTPQSSIFLEINFPLHSFIHFPGLSSSFRYTHDTDPTKKKVGDSRYRRGKREGGGKA